MQDISYIAAFPKSGITYLNFMLFHVLFERPQDAQHIDSDYIFDLHESLARVPPVGEEPRYAKIHFSYGPDLPLLARAKRAVCLVREPIDVMMSVWDFYHLTGSNGLLSATPPQRSAMFEQFTNRWVSSGGMVYPWAGSWVANVTSWLDQARLPKLFVLYENLRTRPFEELKRVLDFLGRPASKERIEAAVEIGKVDNMRKIEISEIATRTTGIFYRPSMDQGYAQGHRFVGRLHEGSAEKILSAAARQQANHVFGPVMLRVRALAGS